MAGVSRNTTFNQWRTTDAFVRCNACGGVRTFGFGCLWPGGLGGLGHGPYKLLKSEKVGGEGGFDYVAADPDTRHLYVVRSGASGRDFDYDLDTLKLVSEIPNVNGGHGVAVDPKTGHAFSSSNPVVMFDSKTLAVIKTIPVQGKPDGILFEPSTERIYVLSHSSRT